MKDSRTKQPKVDPDAVAGRLQASLSQTAGLVAYGFAAHEACNDPHLRLPGSLVQFHFHRTDQLAATFEPWLLTVGLRRYIEVFNEFLIEVGVLSALWQESQTMPFSFDGAAVAKKFRGMNFPKKLDEIEKNIGEALPSAMRTDIESINKSRVILEHDAGVVSAKRGDPFTVSFRGLDMALRTMEEIIAIEQVPAEMPANAQVEVHVEQRRRSFSIGESLTFTAKDFVEMGLSLEHAGVEIILALPPYHAQRDQRPDSSQPRYFKWTLTPGTSSISLPFRLY